MGLFKKRSQSPRPYTVSADVLELNRILVDRIFRVNGRVERLLLNLKPHRGHDEIDYEWDRLTGFREVAIELAGRLYSDPGNILAEPVLEAFGVWLTAHIMQAQGQASPGTIAGYKTLQQDLTRNLIGSPGA